jgi:PST family polysaccharide transporter
MGLLKTSLLNGIAVGTRMGTGLILNKVLAIFVGPAGYAIIGQLQNLISILTTFAAGAINTGVTRYTAEFHGEPTKLRSLRKTAGTITVVGALTGGLLIAIFRNDISIFFLHEIGYSTALVWLACCLLFISLNSLLLAILAGQKDVKRFVTASIAGSVIGLVVSGLLAWVFGLQGVLTALSLGQAISFGATIAICHKLSWCRLDELLGKVDRDITAKLARYVMMAMVTAAAVPVSQIAIRSYIQQAYGASYAGYWDAINKISTIYLTLGTTTLSLYYLPRISEIQNKRELKNEIWRCFRIVVPLTALASCIIFIFRREIVGLLFTKAFMPMVSLMAWQTLGDVIKIASWLFAYVVIGKARAGVFIATEILFSVSLYVLTIICTQIMGTDGLSAAYAANYALYLATMYWLVMMRD